METRLDSARRRAGTAKRALGGAAAVGFVAAMLLARVSHPGHAAQPSSGSGSGSGSVIAPVQSESDDGSGGFFTSPQVSTHVS
jgi:hypothetical protein